MRDQQSYRATSIKKQHGRLRLSQKHSTFHELVVPCVTHWCTTMLARRGRATGYVGNCWGGHRNEAEEELCWYELSGGGICMLLCILYGSEANQFWTWLRKYNVLTGGRCLMWGARDLKKFVSSSSPSDCPCSNENFLDSISNNSF
jgi:hypothetical protein